MDQWQLGGIADVPCVGGSSVVEGVTQTPLDKLQMSLAIGSRKFLMRVVSISD